MRSIRARLHAIADGDRGMTLIEVMVAMFVFAILSTLVLSSLVQIVSTTQRSRAQHAAANLAASEIELARDTGDLFALLDETREVTVNGTTFQVRRETAWVSETVSEAACGAGGGNLRFKRIHVTVTWGGMREGATPVRADTLINPAERINDPSKGTVLVSIIDSLGEGVAGAKVTLTATSGGASVPAITTDAQGCAYFLQVPKGTYDVTVAKTGYTGILVETPQQRDVSVQAGSSTTVGLQYDLAAKFDLTLGPGSTVRPSSMPLTLLSTYGVRTTTLTGTAARQTVRTHPRVSYRVIAGRFQQSTGGECAAVDPGAWPEATVGGVLLAPGAAPELGAEPGATAAVDVPMGLVSIPNWTSNLRATAAATGRPGDPTCDATFQLNYGTVPAGSVVAVPFGTWQFTTNVTLQSHGETRSSDTVTLDPREPAP